MANIKMKLLVCLLMAGSLFVAMDPVPKKTHTDWQVYGGSTENIKYSSLNQVNTTNVARLQVAWTYHAENNDSKRMGPIECNPIIVNGVLYGTSAHLKLFAIDAATGQEKWTFDPADSIANKTWHRHTVNMNRGVAYWADGADKRIIYTAGPVAYAVDANTGKLISTFGKDGGVDLKEGLGRDAARMSVSPTSPAMIYNNLFFLSGEVSDATPGGIRAFDVRTGAQKWMFHTVPYPGEKGYETWQDTTAYKRMGSANAWSGFSLDKKRGILYAGIGSPSNDFYGGGRIGAGLYGNCIVAINANTGKLIWHFQTVHHDVWDMDLSSPPALITVMRNGKKIDALAQGTKEAFIFVLDRVTGKPLFPVVEKPVHTDGVNGEQLWPTQPFPLLPKPYARQMLTLDNLNRVVSDSSYQDIKRRFLSYRSEGIFTPPTERGSIVLPGYDGGGEWGGPAVDPESNILYVNANEMTWVLTLVKPNAARWRTNLQAGMGLYNQNCMVCHGTERQGSGDFPAIVGVEKKYTEAQFLELLSTGRRMMPGFNHLSPDEKNAIAAFVLNNKTEQAQIYTCPVNQTTGPVRPGFNSTGYNKFLTKEGYPAINPPWGTLNAINLNTGKTLWQIPLGEFEELKKKGIPATGRENYGGPVVTAGGLIFIGASSDGKFRAIDKKTGKILWETDLPAPGVATPAVYEVKGRQYIVIACGGSKWAKDKTSDAYVAFALPKK